MNTAFPELTHPRRIDNKKIKKNFLAPLCFGKALKRASIVSGDFFYPGVNAKIHVRFSRYGFLTL
jgi:hypothetical protein